MHFVFGGRAMGMLEYAQRLTPDDAVCDLAHRSPDTMPGAGIMYNVQLLVKSLVQEGLNAVEYFENLLPGWAGKIVVGDEVGCGVVPVEPFERAWRDETGRVYQLLARHASDVTRLWAGIPQALKRGGMPV